MAYFAFEYVQDGEVDGGKEFVIELRNDKLIAHARELLSGKTTEAPHISGRIKKTQAPYNQAYSFHLDPESIDFFNEAIEDGDASPQFVEEHLDEVGGAFLPGRWTPLGSRLTREVTPSR